MSETTAPTSRMAVFLSVALLGTLGAAAVYIIPHATPVHVVLSLPFLLVGQGYLLTAAVLGGESLTGSARLMLSLAFSIAAIVLVALALDVLGFAITTKSLADSLAVAAWLAAAVATRRDVGAVSDVPDRELRRGHTAAWSIGLGLIAVCFTIALVLLAHPLSNTAIASYTQLWARRAPSGTITVGISSAELQPRTYRVVATGATGSRSAFTVALKPGAATTRSVSLAGPPLQNVKVLLFLQGPNGVSASPYRSVSLKP